MQRFIYLAVALCPVSLHAADLSALYPDGTWLVLGIELKSLHEAKPMKGIFQQDGRTRTAIKVGQAFGNTEIVALSHFAPIIDQVERVTLVTGPDQSYDTDDFRLFVEGPINEELLKRTINNECRRLKRAYSTDKIGERTIHVITNNEAKLYIVQLAKDVVVLTSTKTGLTNVMDFHSGNKKSAMSKVIRDRLKSIEPQKRPLWLVVGENRFGEEVLYSSMCATVRMEQEIILEIAMDTPTPAATKQARQLLELYGGTFQLAKTQPLQQALGKSLTVKSTNNSIQALTTVPIKLFGDIYALQR